MQTFCENAVGEDVSLLPVSPLSTNSCVDSAEGLCVVWVEVSVLCFQFVQDGENHIILLQLKRTVRKQAHTFIGHGHGLLKPFDFIYKHWLAKTPKPQTAGANNIDHLLTMQLSNGKPNIKHCCGLLLPMVFMWLIWVVWVVRWSINGCHLLWHVQLSLLSKSWKFFLWCGWEHWPAKGAFR